MKIDVINALNILETAHAHAVPMVHHVDLEKLCEFLPKVKSRYYSLTSDQLENPKIVSICFTLEEFETPLT